MTTKPTKIRTLTFLGQAEAHSAASQLLKKPGDAAVVFRGQPRWFVLSCPCGCGDEISVNLDPRTGPAWRTYQTSRGFTLFPSIWRESGCKSHFIIWEDRILWLDAADFKFDESALEKDVFPLLTSQERSFEELAATLQQIPWAVLTAARGLVQKGLAIEGINHRQGWFRIGPNLRRIDGIFERNANGNV